MILRAGLATLALAIAAPAFHYERPVQLASATAPETCVVLPADLLAHAAPGLEDLRVMTGDREVAYQVRASNDAGDASVVMTRPEQILNLGEHNGAVSFDVEMTEPRYNRLLLRMGRSHFSVLVHIAGLDRLGNGGVSLPSIPFSSNGDEDAPQQRLIVLPESSFRFLHFEIQTLALEPVTPQDVAGVDVWTEKDEPPRYIQVAHAAAPQQKPHETVYEFAVPANVPAERLTFMSDDPNAVFSRIADVERYRLPSQPEAADGGTSRTAVLMQSEGITLAHAPPARRETAAGAANAINLALGAMPYASTIRLTIQNGDDAPLSLHALTLEMRERQLCFLRKPDMSYTLRYGDPALGFPRYDLSPIEAAAITVSKSTLGPERSLAPGIASSQRPFTERHPVLLWVALIAVVGTLGFVALRSARS